MQLAKKYSVCAVARPTQVNAVNINLILYIMGVGLARNRETKPTRVKFPFRHGQVKYTLKASLSIQLKQLLILQKISNTIFEELQELFDMR